MIDRIRAQWILTGAAAIGAALDSGLIGGVATFILANIAWNVVEETTCSRMNQAETRKHYEKRNG